MLSGDMLEDSWAYQEMTAEVRQKGFEKGLHEGHEKGLHEGREIGLHEGVLRALREVIADTIQERFPSLVTLVSSHVQKIEDTTLLRRLSVKLSAAQTAQEAEQAFRAMVKDAQQH